MAKGYLKYLMLKTISDGDVTGYQLIKHVENLTGSKPSTGSVYPQLKSMERDGWVNGREVDGKTFYSITKTGREVIEHMDSVKDDFMIKIHQSVSIANEVFDEVGHFVHVEQMELLGPLMVDIGQLLYDGVDPKMIGQVIEKAREELARLK